MGRVSRDSFPGLIPIGGGEQGLYMQAGKASFSGIYTDTTNVPIRTQLTHVDAMFAQVNDTYSAATDANTAKIYQLNCDPAVTTGTVSVYRSSQGALSGLPFNYMIIGRVEATD